MLTLRSVQGTCLAATSLIAVLPLVGCNPYAPAIGTTFSRVDEYKGTQRDEVPVILDGTVFHGVRGLRLVRQKANGQVQGHTVEVSIMFSESTPIRTLTFDAGDQAIRLSGTSSIANVDARSYGVIYTIFAVFPIQPADLRRLADFEKLLVVASGDVDFGPVEIGPKGLNAIDAYRATFVDADGLGSNVTRSSIRTSD